VPAYKCQAIEIQLKKQKRRGKRSV